VSVAVPAPVPLVGLGPATPSTARLTGVTRPPAVAAAAIRPSPSNWRNELDLTTLDNPLVKDSQWTKLTSLTSAPETVYFQNANKYPFHYDFAHAFLPEFKNMTRQQYDAVSLGRRNQPQQANLGAVLIGPGNNEFALQLVNGTPLDQTRTLALLQSVKKSLKLPPGAKLFYFPTAEQKRAAAAFAPALAAAGFPVGSADQWATGNQVYSQGWAMGRLVYVPTDEIEAKYKSGSLKSTDILLTDDVPAEVPHVAGIVSLSSSTPNSHVALLAQSHNIPFGFARDEALAKQLKALSGKEVTVRASAADGTLTAQALGTMPAAFKKQLLALREPAPLVITAKARTGKYGISMEDLGLDELKHVGSKSANYTILKKTLPTASVNPAVALTFDVWDDFMAQKVPSSARAGAKVTLREEIDARLKKFQVYPPTDVAGTEAALDAVRELIRDTPVPQAVKDGVAASLKAHPKLDITDTLRFRSSTNVEDTDTFTGAGLYDSFSGTLARDLGLQAKPGSHSRGAFDAIKRTMASFYNDNAFLERRRLKVDESKVGMAILVHPSAPDERELANGVVTVTVDASGVQTMKLVTQFGAESVTNPEEGASKPEVVQITRDPQGDSNVWLDQATDNPNVRIGESVLAMPKDYERFAKLFGDAANAFISIRGKTPPLTVDLEFKKEKPGPGDGRGDQFVVKQIRVVPTPSGTGPVALLPAKTELRTAQGEGDDIFAAHAMKSVWQVSNDARWLSGPHADLTVSPLTKVEIDYLEGGVVKHYAGPMSGFDRHSLKAKTADGVAQTIDAWSSPVGKNTLELNMRASSPIEVGPISELSEAAVKWGVTLTKPVNVVRSELDATGTLRDVQRDERALTTRLEKRAVADAVQEKWNFEAPGKGLQGATVKVSPRYRYAVELEGQMVKTERLGQWETSTISGLTTAPLQLKGDFSQTMVPEHHNFSEAFLFEPGLEKGVAAASLAELKRQDIQKILIDQAQKFWVSGANGKWRAL